MEGVVVQWIGHFRSSSGCINRDHSIVDRIRHRSVESPIPVRDSKRCCSCLILGSLSRRVGLSDGLGIVP